ncbi:MAG TPA: hypothetical protein VMJ10_15685 [Kofleriaceae bacterium]|nr:hypothetical protein [Kofleriaceae bacterium]
MKRFVFVTLVACSSPSPAGAPDASVSPPPVDAALAVDAPVSSPQVAVNALAPNLVAPAAGCAGVPDGASQYCDFAKYIAPHVDGISIFVYWKQIDHGATEPCVEGSQTNPCDWSQVDPRIESFVSLGLTVNLIAIGVPEGGTGNAATPAYVFSAEYAAQLGAPPQDFAVCALWPGGANAPVHGSTTASAVWNTSACYTPGGTCSASADTSGFPVVYEKPYETAYAGFVANVVQHYSPRGSMSGPDLASHIGYIRFGVTAGGEAQLICNSVWPGPGGLAAQPLAFAKTAFLDGYVQPLVGAMHAAQPAVGVLINTHDGPPSNTDVSYADIEAQLAVGAGVGIGMESLGIGDAYEYAHGGTCNDDWCANFDNTTGVPHVLQTTIPTLQPAFSVASITGNGTHAEVTCSGPCDFYTGNSGWVQVTGTGAYDGTYQIAEVLSANSFAIASSTTATVTTGTIIGPDFLPVSAPFAAAHHATALEIYACDLFYAFDPNPVTGMNCSTPPGAYSAQYASLLAGLAAQ